MSCITEILNLKGDKDVLVDYDDKNNPWVAVEGGGTYQGYEYLIVLNTLGHRCGYVAIPPKHPYANTPMEKREFMGKVREHYDYDSLDINCHGGLTFMKPDHGLKALLSIPCTDLWIGFDCGHCYDASDYDAMEKYFGKEYKENKLRYCSRDEDNIVRSFDYVEMECQSIIHQLIEKEAA
jgi:hypothetical protein